MLASLPAAKMWLFKSAHLNMNRTHYTRTMQQTTSDKLLIDWDNIAITIMISILFIYGLLALIFAIPYIFHLSAPTRTS